MRISLRSRLIFLVAAAVLFAVAVAGILSINVISEYLTENAYSNVKQIASSGVVKVQNLISQEMSQLRAFAGMSVFTDDSVSLTQKSEELSTILKNNVGKYADVIYFDKDGNGVKRSGEQINEIKTPYLQSALAGKEYISDAYSERQMGGPYFYFAVPVKDKKGNVTGALVSVLKGDVLVLLMKSITTSDGGHPSVVDTLSYDVIALGDDGSDGNVQLENQYTHTEYAGIMGSIVDAAGSPVEFITPETGEKRIGVSYSVLTGTNWSVFVNVNYDSCFETVDRVELVLLISLIATIAISAFVAGFIVRRMLRPLNQVKYSIRNLSQGDADLSKRIHVKGNDEVTDVAGGFNAFVLMLQGIVKGIQDSKDKLVVAGDSLNASAEDTATSITQIIANIDSIHSQITAQSASVQETAGAVNQVASNIESLERMIQNQSTGVEQASAAVEEMIGNISSVNTSVDKMASSFDELISSAQNGAELQINVNERIEEIKNQSESLQEANQAIASIAEQTNLLAMNAAIEAAHAGDAGKGFSVVADEIRKLSETSGAQSKTIGEQLTSIQESIAEVVAASNQSSNAFQIVSTRIQETDEVVRNIKQALEEQTRGSAQIGDALHAMNDSTAEVRIASREMSEGNRHILEEIRLLQEATYTMQSGMDEMAAGARKINETGAALNSIATDMKSSISDIGSQVDLFKA